MADVAVKDILDRGNAYRTNQEHLRDAEYKMTVANLSHDFREAVDFNLRRNKVESNRHVAEAHMCQK